MNKVEEKQIELKKWIEKLGMTQKYFSEQYFIEEYGLNEEEIKAFYEKFKGHLKRKTTHVETIDIYLRYLYEMDEFKKKCYVRVNKIEDDSFGNEFDLKMSKISKNISKSLEVKQ